jgi:hypothetical protein
MSMRKTALLFSVSLTLILSAVTAACRPTPAPTLVPTAALPTPTPLPLSAYRPIQNNDLIEGAKIGYQYALPSPDKPVVVIAFGEGMLELVSVKQELAAGLVAYIQELAQEPRSIYAFDESDPNQAEPSLLTIQANKPVEIIFVPLPEGQHNWSVTETDQGEIRAAYKLIRRQDGGLRFLDAYGIEAMNSFTTLLTLNGGGAGLVYSARLALLRLILSEPAYQRGADVMASQPPQLSQYDSRILKLDPSQTGLAQDLDWVLVSRPGPNPGLPTP